jgi:hypothetical protein
MEDNPEAAAADDNYSNPPPRNLRTTFREF